MAASTQEYWADNYWADYWAPGYWGKYVLVAGIRPGISGNSEQTIIVSGNSEQAASLSGNSKIN